MIEAVFLKVDADASICSRHAAIVGPRWRREKPDFGGFFLHTRSGAPHTGSCENDALRCGDGGGVATPYQRSAVSASPAPSTHATP